MYLSSEYNSNYTGSLDLLLKNKGPDAFKEIFYEIGKRKKTEAVRLINDNKLSFTSLFLLIPIIEALNLFAYLNVRNIVALKICAKVFKNKELESCVKVISPNGTQTYSVLKWMLNTGYRDDGLNDDFDEILDGVVSLLIIEYKDKSILPVVTDMVFKRNKKGTYNHDLIWCIFQSCDLNALKLIAEYLKSSDERDVELSSKLLNFKPHQSIDNEKIYQTYLEWLKGNNSFLYFTGESFQQTSTPEVYCIDLDAKYLGKSISPHNRKMLTPLTQSEQERLEQFHQLDNAEQTHLSNFAYKIQTQDKHLWAKWRSYPVSKQVDIAQSEIGGM